MRRLRLLLTVALALCGAAAAARAQEPYTSGNDEYALELPSQAWKAIPRSDQHTEFINNGDRGDGYLRIRKDVLDPNTSLSAAARREADLKLRYLPGFVGGREERFTGQLSGIVYAYEYTSAGKPMAGRIYFLRADDRNLYLLHFTGRSERLLRIRNQTDAIARSFKLKQ
jgi:opacity protein-like surface antigen